MIKDKLPAPVDISHHFSRVTKNRAQSSIKDFYKVLLAYLQSSNNFTLMKL